MLAIVVTKQQGGIESKQQALLNLNRHLLQHEKITLNSRGGFTLKMWTFV